MIVRELWREAARFPSAFAWSVVLLLLVFATHIGQAVAVAWAMTVVFTGEASDVAYALGLIVVIAGARLVLSLAQTSAATRLGGQVRVALRRKAFQAALSPSRLHDTSVRDGSLRASLGDGIDGTDAYVSRYIPAVVQVCVASPVVVLGVFFLNVWAGIVVAVAAVCAVFGPLLWKRKMARRGLEHWDSYEALSADLLESLRGMATLRSLGDVARTRRKLHDRSEALRAATERVMRVSLAETGITDFAIQAGFVGAVMIAVVHAVTDSAPTFHVYLLLLLSSEVFRPIRDLSRHWHAGFLGVTAIPGLTHIGAFTESQPSPTSTPSSSATLTPTQGQQLQVRDVRFCYPDAELPVLDGLNLTASTGELTALTGASGAGKSTLFDVLLGFLTPDSGSIELDGRPVRNDDIAVVSQRPLLFTGSIRENLVVAGNPSDSELAAACKAAGILKEIHALPAGFDTHVAEAGSSLSGGQRQRLALARALLANRPILLVDEPTSALDNAHADEVMRTLHRIATDRIVIMISHRPESLTDVTCMLRLENGQLNSCLT